MYEKLIQKATQNVSDILSASILYDDKKEKALVVYDTEYTLTNILKEAYMNTLPKATFINFNEIENKQDILDTFDALSPGDLVVLVQSSSFRLNDFRIRLSLFEKDLKVIEHTHLARNTEDTFETYIDALAYDKDWYHNMGHKLKYVLENTETLKINALRSTLTVTGGLELPKLNIGDYTDMKNVGGTFPIGEVFTEALDFQKMNGSFYVYAYADQSFIVDMYEPFRVDVKDGLVVGYTDDAPENFKEILRVVKEIERPMLREIGFGLNRAITKEKYLKDITAFERILGMHFSLGEKHTAYKKENLISKNTKFHVDLFPVVESVYADDILIFKDGKYVI